MFSWRSLVVVLLLGMPVMLLAAPTSRTSAPRICSEFTSRQPGPATVPQRGGGALEEQAPARSGGARCSIDASLLAFDVKRSLLRVERVRIRSGTVEFAASRLELRAGLPWFADSPRFVFCGGLLRATANRCEGRDSRLLLAWPVFRVVGVPVFAAPRWHLPLRPGVSGLLWPSFGYRADAGFEGLQGIYWAPVSHADLGLWLGGSVGRGAHVKVRARYWGDTWNLDGRGDVLLKGGALRAQAAVNGHLFRESEYGVFTAGISSVWRSDSALRRDLADDISGLYRTLQRNRLWIGAQKAGWSLAVYGDLWQQDTLAAANHTGLDLKLELEGAHVPLLGPFWVDLSVGALSTLEGPGTTSWGVRRPGLGLGALLTLGASEVLGPLVLRGAGGLAVHGNERWSGDFGARGGSHLVHASAAVALPLVRPGLRAGAPLLLVEPFVELAFTGSGGWGEAAELIPSGPRRDQLGSLGIRLRRLPSAPSQALLAADLRTSIASDSGLVARVEATVDWSPLRLELMALAGASPLSLHYGEAELCLLHQALCAGVARVANWGTATALGIGPQRWYVAQWRLVAQPWQELTQLTHALRLSAGQLRFELHVVWDPEALTFSFGSAKLGLIRLCGDMSLELRANAARYDRGVWFDTTLGVALHGEALGRCWSRLRALTDGGAS